MNTLFSGFLKYLPLAVGILILAVAAVFVPWHEVVPYLGRLSWTSYALMLVLGTAYYVSRIVRYRYMLRVLGTKASLWSTVMAYFVAQPISLLPGGEAYRTITLRDHSNVPLSKGISVVFIQSFTENVGLVLLALISATILKQQTIIILGLMAIYLMVLVLIRTRRIAEKSRTLINRLPFVNVARSKFHSFIHKNNQLLRGKSLIVLFGSSFVSTLIAATVLYIVANDMDITLSYTQAVIAFTLPAVLQNVTFLPGGIGVNEQGSVGILLVLGATLPAAVALTLIMRFVTLGLGIILGLLAILVQRSTVVSGR
jgi:uncharacterized protein (TIRG00374 family)